MMRFRDLLSRIRGIGLPTAVLSLWRISLLLCLAALAWQVGLLRAQIEDMGTMPDASQMEQSIEKIADSLDDISTSLTNIDIDLTK